MVDYPIFHRHLSNSPSHLNSFRNLWFLSTFSIISTNHLLICQNWPFSVLWWRRYWINGMRDNEKKQKLWRTRKTERENKGKSLLHGTSFSLHLSHIFFSYVSSKQLWACHITCHKHDCHFILWYHCFVSSLYFRNYFHHLSSLSANRLCFQSSSSLLFLSFSFALFFI